MSVFAWTGYSIGCILSMAMPVPYFFNVFNQQVMTSSLDFNGVFAPK
jgi:hypothetical protein